jgi:hypothetical protein
MDEERRAELQELAREVVKYQAAATPRLSNKKRGLS